MDNHRKSVIGNRRNGAKPTGGNSNQRPAQRRPRSSQPSNRPQASNGQPRRPQNRQTPPNTQQRRPNRPNPVPYQQQHRRTVLPQTQYAGGGDGASLPPQKKKHPILKRLLIFVIVAIFILSSLAFALIRFGNLNSDLRFNAGRYNISDNAAAMALNHRIVNIAVFGIDAREDVEGERSDSMMIVSADFEHNKVKVTSLMRDTYVYINEDYGYDKLNAAYSLGGPELALQTINQNFDTAITDYVTIDFTSMVEMVNAVGGVTIDITSEDELYWVNQYLMDVNDKVGTSSPFLTATGSQTLDGSQALAYCRVRYVGNGDYERTQRQRNVLEQVMTKAMALNPIQQYNLLRSVMPYIETSLSFTELLKYAGNALMMDSKAIEQFRLPTDTYVGEGYIDGVSYVFPNTLVDNIEALYDFIYETSYTPSSRAVEISSDIDSAWW